MAELYIWTFVGLFNLLVRHHVTKFDYLCLWVAIIANILVKVNQGG
jgi:hypothetical protein